MLVFPGEFLPGIAPSEVGKLTLPKVLTLLDRLSSSSKGSKGEVADSTEVEELQKQRFRAMSEEEREVLRKKHNISDERYEEIKRRWL